MYLVHKKFESIYKEWIVSLFNAELDMVFF